MMSKADMAALRDEGLDPRAVAAAARSGGVGPLAGIQALRELFGLRLGEAKDAWHASGSAIPLDEYLDGLAAVLEDAIRLADEDAPAS